MELNREDIIKALECCANNACTQCHYHKQEDECVDLLASNALALIKELTEENKKWQWCLKNECEYTEKITVKKIQTMFAVHFGTYTDDDTIKIKDVFSLIDQIADEISK